jgi:uncharacterized membrane protein YeaQ/YmgE (transglycosylase-associated protein family)
MFLVIITWALIGLVIGGLGRFLVPGRNHIGILFTILIGIVGALAGGSVTRELLGAGHDVISFVVSLVIAAVLVALASGAGRSGRSRRTRRRRWL